MKTWCPATELLDELLTKTEAEKTKKYHGENFSIRVAYQCPLETTFKGTNVEAIAHTLEDALVFQNIELFSQIDGKGLLAKFKAIINTSANVNELGSGITNALASGNKAELALDLLELPDATALKPPEYIRSGLMWLAEQVRQHQRELGLPTAIMATEANGVSDSQNGIAA